jgi:hypothetical protein
MRYAVSVQSHTNFNLGFWIPLMYLDMGLVHRWILPSGVLQMTRRPTLRWTCQTKWLPEKSTSPETVHPETRKTEVVILRNVQENKIWNAMAVCCSGQCLWLRNFTNLSFTDMFMKVKPKLVQIDVFLRSLHNNCYFKSHNPLETSVKNKWLV